MTKKKKQTAWFPGSESLPKRKLTPECATDKGSFLVYHFSESSEKFQKLGFLSCHLVFF